MRALSVVAIAVLLAVACGPTPEPADQKGTSPGSAAAIAAPAASTPMAKRAPPRPGEQVSPVIALRAGGEHWSLHVENAGGHAHDADLAWEDGGQRATGSLQYQPDPAPSADAPIVLMGTLVTPAGPRRVRVAINERACKDAAGEAYTHAVHITIEGMAPMHGCGDLAR